MKAVLVSVSIVFHIKHLTKDLGERIACTLNGEQAEPGHAGISL